MKISVPLFDTEGEVTGHEEINVTEVESVRDFYGEKGDFNRVQLIELSDYNKAHPDDVAATLDKQYGYFNYKII